MTIASQKLALQLQYDQRLMERELDGLPDESWVQHVNKRCYQGRWSALPLRCPKIHLEGHPILQSYQIHCAEEWVNLPTFGKLPTLQRMVSAICAPVKSIRLMKLEAGAEILPHCDAELCVEKGEARLHVPLQYNADVKFYSDGKLLPMSLGELWYVNADLEHSVVNSGRQHRINLVIDVIADQWLRALLSD